MRRGEEWFVGAFIYTNSSLSRSWRFCFVAHHRELYPSLTIPGTACTGHAIGNHCLVSNSNGPILRKWRSIVWDRLMDHYAVETVHPRSPIARRTEERNHGPPLRSLEAQILLRGTVHHTTSAVDVRHVPVRFFRREKLRCVCQKGPVTPRILRP